jgi:hypothetical protein
VDFSASIIYKLDFLFLYWYPDLAKNCLLLGVGTLMNIHGAEFLPVVALFVQQIV